MRGALPCAALALLWTASAEAQVARDLTVEESVRMGLEHNASLRAVRADVDAAQAGRSQVDAARLPALRSQASYTRLSGNIPGVEFTLPGTDSTFTFQGVQLDRLHTEVSLQLPLLTQLRLGHESRAADHDAAAAELTLEPVSGSRPDACRRPGAHGVPPPPRRLRLPVLQPDPQPHREGERGDRHGHRRGSDVPRRRPRAGGARRPPRPLPGTAVRG